MDDKSLLLNNLQRFTKSLKQASKILSNQHMIKKLYNSKKSQHMLALYDTQNKQQIHNLEKNINYKFKNSFLILEALTHGSYNTRINKLKDNTTDTIIPNYEKLEFLGDCVLNFIISLCIMYTFPEMNEGELSKIRSYLVNEQTLFYLANKINLGKYIILGKGEELDQGRNKISILSDAMEALVGAIYLDSDFNTCFKVVVKLFNDIHFLNNIHTQTNIDYKTILQEWAQKHLKTLPQYKVIKEDGPTHAKIFEVGVYLNNNKLIAKGSGYSKKEASQQAAKAAYFILTQNN